MEFNTNKKVDQIDARYIEIRRASESRGAGLKATVDRITDSSEALSQIQSTTDSLEISSSLSQAGETDRSGRIAELRAMVEDGSLFDQERLERAAMQLLSDRV